MVKRLILLTKSFKNHNYCIAGVDEQTGEWIRCYSSDTATEGAVLIEHAKYEDGTEVEVLDIVDIEFIEHKPSPAQQENWLYDHNVRWRKVGKSTLQQVLELRGTDELDPIFGSTEHKIRPEQADGHSLALLKVQYPRVKKTTFTNDDGSVKKSITYCFKYNGNWYNFFSISQFGLKDNYQELDDGDYKFEQSSQYVVLSLTGLHTDGCHYKMMAQILE